MSKPNIFRVMLQKEVRSMLRERSQIRGLVVGIGILTICFVVMFVQVRRKLANTAQQHSNAPVVRHVGPMQLPPEIEDFMAGRPVQLNDRDHAILTWIAIAVPPLLGLFFSMGTLISAVLSTFVGEKEARTLEILLASPLSDDLLYASKCISVLLPSAIVAYSIGSFAAILSYAMMPAQLVSLPTILLVDALLVSIPVGILPPIWFVGLGAAISARAETFKGASQALGGTVVVVFFGLFYGGPIALAELPGFRHWLYGLADAWLAWPFVSQYFSVLLALGIPAAVLLMIGRLSFRRDRMLA